MNHLCTNRSNGWHCVGNNTWEVSCTDSALSTWGNFDFNPYPCSVGNGMCNPDVGRCFMPFSDKVLYFGLVALAILGLLACGVCCWWARYKNDGDLSKEEGLQPLTDVEEVSLETSSDGSSSVA